MVTFTVSLLVYNGLSQLYQCGMCESGMELFLQLQIEYPDYVIPCSDILVMEKLETLENTTVSIGIQKSTMQKVSVKQLKEENPKDSVLLEFSREIQVMAKCRSPFVMPMIGFTCKKPYAIVTELVMGDSLMNMLHARKTQNGMSGDQKNQIAMGIAAGMAYMHEQSILHRDLRAGNILVGSGFCSVLYDFHMATFAETSDNPPNNNIVGTPAYMAPELFEVGTYSNKVDVYSFAIILWEMETEQIPFRGFNTTELKEMLRKEERPSMPPRAPQQLKNLIQMCWQQNPEKRPTFQKILELFLTKKVYFEGAKDKSIQKMKNMIKEYNKIVKSDIKNVTMTDRIPLIFEKMDTIEIINLMKTIDENNCLNFFNSVFYIVQYQMSTKVVQIALFEMLKLIILNYECFSIFVDNMFFEKLPFLDEELQLVSLSFLIPIFQYQPELVSVSLLQTIEMIIPSQPIKVLRLFSILLKEPRKSIKEIQKVTIDILIKKADVFIKNDSIKFFLQIVYKAITSFQSIYENRFKNILSILINCLNYANNYEIIKMVYSSLYYFHNQVLNIDPFIIQKHLEYDLYTSFILHFLGLVQLNKINIELLQAVYNLKFTERWREIAFFNLCKNLSINNTYLPFFQNLFSDPNSPESFKIRVSIILMKNQSFVENIQHLTELFKFFNALILESKIEYFSFILNYIIKLYIDEDNLKLIQNTKLFENAFKMANKIDQEQYYILEYIIIDKLGRICFMPELMIIHERAIEHLKSKTYLQHFSLSFYALISNYKESLKDLISSSIQRVIRSQDYDSETKRDMAVLALENIHNLCKT